MGKALLRILRDRTGPRILFICCSSIGIFAVDDFEDDGDEVNSAHTSIHFDLVNPQFPEII